MRATVNHVSRHGVDGVSVADLTKEAGVSRPTFYSHFDDIDGLFAEVWLEYFPSWWQSMCDPADSSVYQRAETLALLQIFLIGHRSPQVDEAVMSTLPKIIEDSFPDIGDRTVAMWTFANRIGIIATEGVWPKALLAVELDSYLRAVSGRVTFRRIMSAEELPQIGPEEPASDHEKIVLATMSIVQKSGVNGLSISRLGRMLRVTSGFIYPRITSRDALVAEAFSYALRSAHTSNIARWQKKKLGVEGFAEFLVGGLGNPRTHWRRFRAEVLIAAHSSDELAGLVRSALEDFADNVGRETAKLPVPKQLVETMTVLVHTLLFGFSAMHHAGIDVRSLAHTGVIRAMVAEIGRRVITGKTLRSI